MKKLLFIILLMVVVVAGAFAKSPEGDVVILTQMDEGIVVVEMETGKVFFVQYFSNGITSGFQYKRVLRSGTSLLIESVSYSGE